MSDHLDITPPESFYEAPITPPPTDEKKPPSQIQSIVQFLDNRRTGSSHTTENAQKVFRLPRAAVNKLFKTRHFGSMSPCGRISRTKSGMCSLAHHLPLPASNHSCVRLTGTTICFESLMCAPDRYDYFSRVEQFILRMPSSVQELCLSSLVCEIESQLSQYRASGNTRSQAFAKDVRPEGSVDLALPPDDDGHVNRHTPDGSFGHRQATWPGVVIEVAFSQAAKNLDRLAWDYISDSNGGIQVVVGLDLSYNAKGASLSVWRPVITTGEDGIDDFDCVRMVHQARIHSPPCSMTEINI